MASGTRPGQSLCSLKLGFAEQATGASPPAQPEAWGFFLACSHPCCWASLPARPASMELLARGTGELHTRLPIKHGLSKKEKKKKKITRVNRPVSGGSGLGGLVERNKPHKRAFQSRSRWPNHGGHHWKPERLAFIPPLDSSLAGSC